MKTFERIDQYTGRLQKMSWTEEEKVSAICIDLIEEGPYSFIFDVRKTWPEALKLFLFHCFTSLYSKEKIGYKKTIFKELNFMYKAHFAEVEATYLDPDRLGYNKLLNDEGKPKALRKHQIDALVRMIPKQHNFLAFTMGLGKTLTTATISKTCKIQRTIIISPAKVKWNWYHDMTDDWGFDPMLWTVLDRRKSKCMKAFIERFVVVNFEMIQKPWVWEHLTSKECGHIVIDEVHKCKNHKTKQYYKNVEKLIEHFPDARTTQLTGTPMPNRVVDLFAYFKMIKHTLGQVFHRFKIRYAKTSGDNGKGKIIGIQNVDELKLRMSNFMIRKMTAECIDLPELSIQKYYLDESEITQEYKDLIAEMYKSRMAKKETQDKRTVNDLQETMDGNIHSLNRILATAKAKSVIELADKIISEGRKVVIFAVYKDALKAVEDHYGDICVKVDGSVDAHKADKHVQRFKNDPKCTVFLGNNKSAGVGINLVNASDVIFMNFPFTPDDVEQPYKRLHRSGQKNNVRVYLTIVKNSIDEQIYGIISGKSNDINETLDKGKKGVVYYGSVTDQIFRKIMDQYAKDNGLENPVEESNYEEV